MLVAAEVSGAQSGGAGTAHTQVVMLGTGTPQADPERSGPAVAVVVNDAAYLVDCGPGVVRRAAAAERAGIHALAPQKLKVVFITHLHSDHTLGYPDLIFSPWVLGRTEPLQAYGPRGLRAMTGHIEKAWKEDVRVRTEGLEGGNRTGSRVVVKEIAPGEIYRDANVRVTAFAVKHGSWKQAFGYRFDTAGRSIVISGDTAPSETVVEACHGCDVLLHEIYNPKRRKILEDPKRLAYFRAFHTSPEELAEIAQRAKPKLLVLYHQGMGEIPEGDLLEQVRARYAGAMVSAKDLGVY